MFGIWAPLNCLGQLTGSASSPMLWMHRGIPILMSGFMAVIMDVASSKFMILHWTVTVDSMLGIECTYKFSLKLTTIHTVSTSVLAHILH